MSAPSYVPRSSSTQSKLYTSPPRRSGSWHADRPGEITNVQPEASRLGSQGPDQGFALKLASTYREEIVRARWEHYEDIYYGASLVAMKRASAFGRGPMQEDLQVALTLWGFIGANSANTELQKFREHYFSEVAHPHHYTKQRTLVDIVDSTVLLAPLDTVEDVVTGDWEQAFLHNV